MLCQIHFNIFSKWWFEELLIYWLCTVPIAYRITSKLLHLIGKILEFLMIILYNYITELQIIEMNSI